MFIIYKNTPIASQKYRALYIDANKCVLCHAHVKLSSTIYMCDYRIYY